MPSLRRILTRLLRVRPYEVELLRSARRTTPFSWSLLAAGLLGLLLAVLVWKPAWDRKTALAQDLTRLHEELAHLGFTPPASAGAVTGRVTAGEAAVLADELRRPWHELFDQIENTETQDVHIVSLGVEAHFSTLQLVVEGRNLAKLVKFAQQLGGDGPIRTMALTHQEWRDALGAHVVSASMQGDLVSAKLPSAAIRVKP